MITPEEIQQCRSPSGLRKCVDQVMDEVNSDASERKLGIQKKGWYKEFVDEIIPLSRFAEQRYPETYRIKPVLGSQGYDALVFDETGTEVDRVEITRPHDGAAKAIDARLVVNRGISRVRVQDQGEDFNELIPFVVRTCESKAQKDYANCTLVVAIDFQPPIAEYETCYEEQVRNLIDKLRQIEFKAKRAFLLILPDRVETIDG